MGGFSIWHWLVVLIIVVLVFGTKKLRNVGKDLGSAVHDFKEGLDGTGDKDKKEDTNTPKIKADDADTHPDKNSD